MPTSFYILLSIGLTLSFLTFIYLNHESREITIINKYAETPKKSFIESDPDIINYTGTMNLTIINGEKPTNLDMSELAAFTFYYEDIVKFNEKRTAKIAPEEPINNSTNTPKQIRLKDIKDIKYIKHNIY